MPLKRKKKKAKQDFIMSDDFFSGPTNLSAEEKEMLVSMIASKPFRVFEKYLSQKQTRKAKDMVAAPDTEKMLHLRSQIRCLSEITADMHILWNDIKKADKKDITLQNLPPLLNGKVFDGMDEAPLQNGGGEFLTL